MWLNEKQYRTECVHVRICQRARIKDENVWRDLNVVWIWASIRNSEH